MIVFCHQILLFQNDNELLSSIVTPINGDSSTLKFMELHSCFKFLFKGCTHIHLNNPLKVNSKNIGVMSLIPM